MSALSTKTRERERERERERKEKRRERFKRILHKQLNPLSDLKE